MAYWRWSEDRLRALEGIFYKCLRCGYVFPASELPAHLYLTNKGGVRCPKCGYRVLEKTRVITKHYDAV